MVQIGQPLLAIVPLEGVWVVANLKETQVARVRAGQPATIRVDTFPDRLFLGRVDSISAGTTLIAHVTPWSAATADRLARLQDVYLGAGVDAGTARRQALRHLYDEIERQASMKAFGDDFLRLAASSPRWSR
jgi:membrane fusion protein (multidrug efflux system)